MLQCEVTTTGAGRRLTLAPVLDILVAEPLRDLLRESVVLGGRVEIDASKVERIGTPCVQVLVAGWRALAEKGLEVVFVAPSEPFMNAFYELGLFEVVAEWNVEQ